MSKAQQVVYGTADYEASLNTQHQELASSNTKEPRCSFKAKLFTAGVATLALTLGGLGYYYGTKPKVAAATKPNYSYKRVAFTNSTTSAATPVSLASSNDEQCTWTYNSVSGTSNIVPMPHQIVICEGTTYCSGGYVLVSLYNYEAYISDAQTLLLYDWNDNNMHSYSQGKYIQSMFSENKTEQTIDQKLVS
jgi:hypothetical protein